MKLRPAIALALMACLSIAPICGDDLSITPKPKVQGILAELTAAKDEAQVRRALARLTSAADRPTIIVQLVYALMNTHGDRDAMIPGVVVDRLAITPAELHSTLEPYRQSPDPKVRAQIENLLGKDIAPK